MSTGRNTTQRDRDRKTIARGEPPCVLCDQPIDYTLGMAEGVHGKRCKGGGCLGCVPHPLRFEVDHIVPLSKGGLDILENKASVHRRCNREKWDRLDEGADVRTFVTWRTW